MQGSAVRQMMNKMVYHFSPHAYHLVPALSIMLCGSSAVAEWTDELVDYTEESSKTLPKKLRKVYKDLSPWWSYSPYASLLLFLLSDFHVFICILYIVQLFEFECCAVIRWWMHCTAQGFRWLDGPSESVWSAVASLTRNACLHASEDKICFYSDETLFLICLAQPTLLFNEWM